MPASSDPKSPNQPRLEGHHWIELTATLSCDTTEAFAEWIEDQLSEVAESLEEFVTPNSLRKSLRR
jgi:hypothetical protein